MRKILGKLLNTKTFEVNNRVSALVAFLEDCRGSAFCQAAVARRGLINQRVIKEL